MKPVVAVVQARMGSQRFPGKMMQKLGNYALLEWVLTRVQMAQLLDGIILATSTHPNSDPLEGLAATLAVPAYRGQENDVLDRMTRAAEKMKAATVVRVCADNPFISGEEIDRLIQFYQGHSVDYAFNHIPRQGNNYADGLGAEILSYELLLKIHREAVEARHREHATLFIWDHPERFKIATFPAPSTLAFPDVKLDIDSPEDLQRLQQLNCLDNIRVSASTVVHQYRQFISGLPS